MMLSYDPNGNLGGNDAGPYLEFQYDTENRLCWGAGDGQPEVYYYHDGLGRLAGRENHAGLTRFIYDNEWRVIAEYDESYGTTVLQAKYVYGPEIDEPVRMTRGRTNYYYHAAALGTVTEITSTNGTLLESYRYDVYGTPEMRDGSGNLLSSSAIGNRLMFQGRDRDPDTGLYNFRHRYYSPSLGRFAQVDPYRTYIWLILNPFVSRNLDETFSYGLRMPSGELQLDFLKNIYIFVDNSPVNYVDPLGLKKSVVMNVRNFCRNARRILARRACLVQVLSSEGQFSALWLALLRESL